VKQKIEQLIKDAIIAAVDAGELSLIINKAKETGFYVETSAEFYVEASKDTQHGDFASTIALVIAKQEGKTPRAVAGIIQKHIKDSGGILEKIEIAGPGFINFFLTANAWLGVLKEIEASGEDFGRSAVGGGKKINLEYVSANPTGPLHIGHGRGAAVGDSLARLLKFAGYDVHREFYINDYGSQVQNLGESIFQRYRQLAGNGEPEVIVPSVPQTSGGDDAEPDETDVTNLYLGEYITDIAKLFMEDSEFMAMSEDKKRDYCREEGIKMMLRQIEATLSRFGVSFDEWFSERKLYSPRRTPSREGQGEGEISGPVDLVSEAITDLRAKGLVYEDGGAVWLNTMKFGDDKDRVLVRNNGQTTYFASDIAYHRDKFGRGYQELIDIWGADHHGYIPRMKAAIAALGHDPEDFQVLLVQLVNLMREGQPVKMSKRAGTFVTLDEVIDEVGADACRFTFLLRRPDSHLDFDLELVKRQSAENPVYYVQYAHARLSSVFRQADDKGVKLPPIGDVDLGRLTLPEELKIMKTLSAFPDLLEGAAQALEPHRLTYYLQDLAAQLHSYYFKHRIIVTDADGEYDLGLTYARLYLVKAVRSAIAIALGLLGVSAPETM